MYEVFYVDSTGKYGEGEGMFLLDPNSLPDDIREQIADLLEADKGYEIYELLRNLNRRDRELFSTWVIEAGNHIIYQATKRAEMLDGLRRFKEDLKVTHPDGLFPKVSE